MIRFMAKYVAAIDQGTTSTRCMIFNHSGESVAIHQLEHEQIYPQPGWVEHDPLEIWQNTQEVIKRACKKLVPQTHDIAAVGITNQRETALVWDRKTGQPYHNAVVWQDTRTDKICSELDQGWRAGSVPNTGRLALSYVLLGSQDPVAFGKRRWPASRCGNGRRDFWQYRHLDNLEPDRRIGRRSYVTDVTNASRTMLMDLAGTSWNDEILKTMTVPRSMLPEIRSSSDPNFYGHTLDDGPFKGRIPVCGDLGDQQAAMVGQTCFSPGEAKNTYGTGCFMLMNTGPDIVPSKHGLLTTTCYKFGDQPTVYALEGSIAIAGALVQWLRDNLRLIETAPDVENLARTVEDNGGIYFVPAFSGLFAPYWRSDARGVIAGLTRYVDRGHIARAALEATAFQTREVLDAMDADSGVTLTALKVDGGMVHNDLLMKFQADVLGVPVIRPRVAETTALGAAYAAGLASGFWQNTDEMRANWGVDKTWEPADDDTARTKLYAEWKKAVTRTFDWLEP